jgi:hypothetical protein
MESCVGLHLQTTERPYGDAKLQSEGFQTNGALRQRDRGGDRQSQAQLAQLADQLAAWPATPRGVKSGNGRR